MQLVELHKIYDELTKLDAEVLAISTDNLEQSRYAVEELALPFQVLYDIDGQVPRAYGVFNHFGDGLATGSIFVIGLDGRVTWSYIYRGINDVVRGNRIVAAVEAVVAD